MPPLNTAPPVAVVVAFVVFCTNNCGVLGIITSPEPFGSIVIFSFGTRLDSLLSTLTNRASRGLPTVPVFILRISAPYNVDVSIPYTIAFTSVLFEYTTMLFWKADNCPNIGPPTIPVVILRISCSLRC